MSDSPIVVSGQALSTIKGTVKSPIVVPSKVSDSNIINSALGIKSSVYKVTMVANGKTFNMLLPPSIESKHPGRSNPLQLPGLQIKAAMSISKLKIPGFFPIYQHLGVESLTVSMSGMFTAYDGISTLSTAYNWESAQDINIKQDQDSYAAACEFNDFAVKTKSLIEVVIQTSDGSFIPKSSTSKTFRDSNSNIKFKGYVKELEQVYIRQDRVYYMIRFEIVDHENVCKTVIKTTNKLINSKFDAALGKGKNYPLNAVIGKGQSLPAEPISDQDRQILSKEIIQQAEKIKQLIDSKISIDEINKEIDKENDLSLLYKLLLYAEHKNYNVDNSMTKILQSAKETGYRTYPSVDQQSLYRNTQFYSTTTLLCQRLNDSCDDLKIQASKQEIENNKFINSNQITTPVSVSVISKDQLNQVVPSTVFTNSQLLSSIDTLSNNYTPQNLLIKALKANKGIIDNLTMNSLLDINTNLSDKYTYVGNTTSIFSNSPVATFQTTLGQVLLLVPSSKSNSKFKLIVP